MHADSSSPTNIGVYFSSSVPIQASTSAQYDAMGNVFSSTDELGQTTYFTYDAQNRLLSQRLPGLSSNVYGPTTNYSYDANGNLQTQTDPDGNVITYGYDAMNRLKFSTTPVFLDGDNGGANSSVMTSSNYSYDANGNVLEQIDANGNATGFSYDHLNRLSQERWYDGIPGSYDDATHWTKKIDYTYDPQGRLLNAQTTTTTAGSPAVTTNDCNYSYDALGRVLTDKDSNAIKQTNSYDANSNRIRLQVQMPGGAVDSTTYYQYDRQNNLTAMLQQSGSGTSASNTGGSFI